MIRPESGFQDDSVNATIRPVMQRTQIMIPVWIPVALLMFGAFLLRIIGIDWGLPTAGRLWSFHPDESQVLVAAQDLNIFTGRLDNGFYNYGQWFLLTTGTLIHIGERFGLLRAPVAGGIPTAEALLIARLVSAILGTATVWFVMDTAKRVGSKACGLLAGSVYSVMPLATQHAHFATVDVAATFWISVAMWGAVGFCTNGSKRSMMIAALAVGFAAATKYNAGLSLFSLVLAWALRPTRQLSLLVALLTVTGITFVFGCPGILLNTSQFLNDLTFEARHMGSGSENIFVDTLPALFYHPFINGPWAVGYLWPAIGVSLIHVLIRRRHEDFILAIFLVPYFALIGMAQVKFARYGLPLLPVLAVFTGYLFQKRASGRNYLGWFAALCTILTAPVTVGWVHQFTVEDSRSLAAKAIRTSQLPTVLFARRPWFWSPSLSPEIGHFSPGYAAKNAQTFEGPPSLIVPTLSSEWDTELLLSSEAASLVISEIEVTDVLRLHNKKTELYLDAAKRIYPRVAVYGTPLRVPGLTPFRNTLYGGWMTLQNAPHDMLYVNPQIWVLTR